MDHTKTLGNITAKISKLVKERSMEGKSLTRLKRQLGVMRRRQGGKINPLGGSQSGKEEPRCIILSGRKTTQIAKGRPGT